MKRNFRRRWFFSTGPLLDLLRPVNETERFGRFDQQIEPVLGESGLVPSQAPARSSAGEGACL